MQMRPETIKGTGFQTFAVAQIPWMFKIKVNSLWNTGDFVTWATENTSTNPIIIDNRVLCNAPGCALKRTPATWYVPIQNNGWVFPIYILHETRNGAYEFMTRYNTVHGNVQILVSQSCKAHYNLAKQFTTKFQECIASKRQKRI